MKSAMRETESEQDEYRSSKKEPKRNLLHEIEESKSTPAHQKEDTGIVPQSSFARRFSPTDFLEGQPDAKSRFTEVVRQFSRQLLRSTCQVMKGCKQPKAQ